MEAGELAVEKLKKELLDAEHILNTEYSFDLAESSYVKCLNIIKQAPEFRERFEDLLIWLFDEKKVSDEPIAYLMHCLRWPRIKYWMEEKLKQDPYAMATGAPLEKVINAYSDSWENRDYYKFLDKDGAEI